ncbi:MAG: preprotein translocase subunit YajC [Oscillospiraceae bacterium]|nr:preprotein translocase subunit YajC [Oscillospiraceae bacterium]
MFQILTENVAAGAAGGGSMIFMIVIMFAIFYFFIIRPENQKKKKTEEMRNSLSLGDEITTIGGITGKLVQITEDTITFETGEDRVRIQTKKWAISTTAKMEAEEAAKAKTGGGFFGARKK